MKAEIELLSPAKNLEIGIAAIDCGADAVYIAGPNFGARTAASNSIEDIKGLCTYAHKFGARIFLAINTILYDSELEDAYNLMLEAQDAGVDALIIQDFAILEMAKNGFRGSKRKLSIPLHASTQCAIRTPEEAKMLEGLGFSRLILERALSLKEIRAIRAVTSCELEFFVHGALCVCYSGQCYISEQIAKRSANRGECIQACRSLYDLVDSTGRVLVKNKALLSLKDLNLIKRISELSDAGISSFKIEGRLKNISYVKNIVKEYSQAINKEISSRGGYRASFGANLGGFIPDPNKTFNRGYTEFYLDKKKNGWANMNAPKSMGEEVGTIININKGRTDFQLRASKANLVLNNGDGFSFIDKNGKILGIRGDVCDGTRVRCKSNPSLYVGAVIYRNLNVSFERETEKNLGARLINVGLNINCNKNEEGYIFIINAESEDGRRVKRMINMGSTQANNVERMKSIINNQFSKTSLHYNFSLSLSGEELPHIPASVLNEIRREIAEELSNMACISRPLINRTLEVSKNRNNGRSVNLNTKDSVSDDLISKNTKDSASKNTDQPLKTKIIISYKNNIANKLSKYVYQSLVFSTIENAYELAHQPTVELMRTKYCIKYELGLCSKLQKAKDPGKLSLVNNGQIFPLKFDCTSCEMVVLSSSANSAKR